MRIGLNGRFYAAPITGVQRVARELAKRLCADADVTIFLPGGVTRDVPANARIVRGRLRGNAWEQIELPMALRQTDCGPLLNLAGPGVLRGARNALFVHDVFPITHPHWFTPTFAAWYRYVLPVAARRAALLLAPSEWSKHETARVLGISSQRIHVVPQGIAPLDRAVSPAEAASLRERLGLADRYILAPASGDARKNTAFLRSVLAGLHDRGDRISLVWVGAVSSRVHGKSARSNDPRITELGYVSDDTLRALYTGATLFCYPSLAEGFGRPPLEAMCCGTAAVVADYGCAAEVLGHSAPILPQDREVWIDTLHTLLNDEDARAGIVARGRQQALRYNWSNSARAVLAACHTIESAARTLQPAAP